MGKRYTIGRVMKHKKNVMCWIPQLAEATVGTRMTSQGGTQLGVVIRHECLGRMAILAGLLF